MDVQATGEAFSPKKHPALQNMIFIKCVYLCGSFSAESGSTDLIESGSETLHFRTLVHLHDKKNHFGSQRKSKKQCCGSGSGTGSVRIRNFWPDPVRIQNEHFGSGFESGSERKCLKNYLSEITCFFGFLVIWLLFTDLLRTETNL
jgi:hypothetical protein